MAVVKDLAEQLAPSIVGLGRGARGGSGFVVAPDRVLTLAHHLRGEEVEVAFAGGRSERARVAAGDPDLDVALLEVATGDAPPLTWADDGAPDIGDDVFALADPGGSGLRATHGAVSGVPTQLRGRRGRPVEGVVEHTAPLPRGSGGGPLVDGEGRVIGVNALRQPGGFILALPAAALRQRVEAMLGGRAVEARTLGVALVPRRAARHMRRAVGLEDRDGLLVGAVVDGSPAGAAGVRRGDLVVALGGTPVARVEDLVRAIDAAPADATVTLVVVRGHDERELSVSFAAPAAAA